LRSAQPGAGHGAERQMFRPLHAFLPVIVVCDCDSRADNAGTATYANLLGAGFDDAWLEAAPAPGRPRAPDRGPAQSGKPLRRIDESTKRRRPGSARRVTPGSSRRPISGP